VSDRPPGKPRGPGRAVLAMNVLGDEWVEELARTAPPDPWFRSARKAYNAFAAFLWVGTVDVREDAYGGMRPEQQSLEVYRRTLPAFEIFQAWYNREEHKGGLRQRVQAEAKSGTFAQETGLLTEAKAWR
jgi:hypothetical protein